LLATVLQYDSTSKYCLRYCRIHDVSGPKPKILPNLAMGLRTEKDRHENYSMLEDMKKVEIVHLVVRGINT
jgi:hypothetical protein